MLFKKNSSVKLGCLICEGNDHENNHDEEDISPLVPQIESGGLESTDAGMTLWIYI